MSALDSYKLGITNLSIMVEKVKKPKAVRAWAIVSPDKNILCIGIRYKEAAWYLASKSELGWYDEDDGESEKLLKKKGYRCIRVTISPE